MCVVARGVRGEREKLDRRRFPLFSGPRNPPFDENLVKALEIYEEGFRKFRARDFVDAGELFARFLKIYPDDVLAKIPITIARLDIKTK